MLGLNKIIHNIRGNILLPVTVMVGLGVVVSSMNALITNTSIRRINQRTNELLSLEASELAAWQSYYYTGAVLGNADAQGRFQVTLNTDYSSNLPASLVSALPANSLEGTPLNIAQTLPFDSATTILTRVTAENFRYHPTQNVSGSLRNCGYLGISGQNVGYQECLAKAAPPPSLCPPGVCTAAIETCVQITEAKTPILISTEAQLLAMDNANHYELAGDITMTGKAQVTKLDLSNIILNGKNHTIKNLVSRNDSQKMLGLFRGLNCVLIKDLKIEGGTVPNTTKIQTGGFLAQSTFNTALINFQVLRGLFTLQYNTNLAIPAAGLIGLATDTVLSNVSVNSSIASGGTAANAGGYGNIGGIIGEMKGNGSQLTNVLLSGSVAVGEASVGGIVGLVWAGNILRAKVTGNLSSTGDGDIGGIVGSFIGNGSVRESVFSGTITGASGAGGIASHCGTCIIEKCNSTGNITANYNLGGIVGDLLSFAGGVIQISQNRSSGTYYSRLTAMGGAQSGPLGRGGIVGRAYCTGGCTIADNYTSANIQSPGLLADRAQTYTGGILGTVATVLSANPPSSTITFKNCVATGPLACTACAGRGGGLGYVGTPSLSTINTTESFFDTTTTGVAASSVIGGFVGKTTAELKTLTTYPNWDFNTIWILPAGGYPRLQWEP